VESPGGQNYSSVAGFVVEWLAHPAHRDVCSYQARGRLWVAVVGSRNHLQAPPTKVNTAIGLLEEMGSFVQGDDNLGNASEEPR